MKTCTKCGEEKPREDFSKDKSNKDGLQSHCKECQRAGKRERRAKLAARSDAELEAARSKVLELRCNKCKTVQPTSEFPFNRTQASGWADQCRSCMSEHSREWREDNPEYGREYHQKNRETRNEYMRVYHPKWRAANPDKVKSYDHARRARKVNLYGNEPDHQRIAEHMKMLANDPCIYCGTTESDSFHWDHFVPLAKGGPHEWWNIVRSCESCNLSKNANIWELPAS